jgi:hypothetical protein
LLGNCLRPTIFNPEVYVYLVKDVAHAQGTGVGEHDEAQVGRSFVVVKLVGGSAEANERVVLAAELSCHVPEREDGSVDELCVILGWGCLGRGECSGGWPAGL